MKSDLISRDYLLEAYDREHAEIPEKVRKLIAEAPALTWWIPCSEKMPEETEAPNYMKIMGVSTCSKEVIVTIRIEDRLSVTMARTKNGKWDWENSWIIARPWEVIAWMPWPEPYKKEVRKTMMPKKNITHISKFDECRNCY